MNSGGFRLEHDSMGELKVPQDALWGAQTQRAIDNFPISGRPLPRAFIRALALIKQASAQANAELGLLDGSLAKADRRCGRRGRWRARTIAIFRSMCSRPALEPAAT